MSAYASPIPGASIYAGASLLAKTAYQKSLARINQQRGTTIRNAGFTSKIDPETGMVSGLAVDPNNKYGQFQQLNRNQAQQDESVRWQAQDRGLGTGGGLAAQMRNNVRYDFGKQDSDFATGLQQTLSGYTDQQTQAAQDRNSALYQAELAAAQAAQQNGDWSPTDYTGVELPDYGPGVSTVTAPVTGVKAGGGKKAVKSTVFKPTNPGWGAKSNVAKGLTPAGKKPAPKKILPPGQAKMAAAAKKKK